MRRPFRNANALLPMWSLALGGGALQGQIVTLLFSCYHTRHGARDEQKKVSELGSSSLDGWALTFVDESSLHSWSSHIDGLFDWKWWI